MKVKNKLKNIRHKVEYFKIFILLLGFLWDAERPNNDAKRRAPRENTHIVISFLFEKPSGFPIPFLQ